MGGEDVKLHKNQQFKLRLQNFAQLFSINIDYWVRCCSAVMIVLQSMLTLEQLRTDSGAVFSTLPNIRAFCMNSPLLP